MNLEELVVDLITKDDELLTTIRNKVKDALSKVDIVDVVAEQLSHIIEAVFEDDTIYSVVEKSIQEEIKKALVSHFRG